MTCLAQEVEAEQSVRSALCDLTDVERLQIRKGPRLRPGAHDDTIAHAHLEDTLARLLGVDAHLRLFSAALESLLNSRSDLSRPRLECAS